MAKKERKKTKMHTNQTIKTKDGATRTSPKIAGALEG